MRRETVTLFHLCCDKCFGVVQGVARVGGRLRVSAVAAASSTHVLKETQTYIHISCIRMKQQLHIFGLLASGLLTLGSNPAVIQPSALSLLVFFCERSDK